MTTTSQKKRGVATNSILLAFVQCLTMVTGILQTMILSRALTETEYGTYSQGMLIVNFLVPFLLLGLANGITYFSGQKEISKSEYISTILTIIIILGSAGAVGIIVFSQGIQSYFNNSGLAGIIPIVAILPLLLNLITAYQTLFIAEDMALSIAIRNAVVAVAQISIVAVSVLVFHDIRLIFSLLVAMDLAQVIIFVAVFQKRKYAVKLRKPQKEIVRKIFAYSIPLALSTAIGTLSVYMDKLLIGRMMSVEDFALYSNMSKELPFAFIVSSFTTVIMPAFIRMHAEGEDDKLKKYWGRYLELGMHITWILCGAAIFCAKDLLLFLYSEKYARGIAVFVIYLVVEMCRYSYFGMILSVFGKTRIIMFSSLASLVCNFILNIILFNWLGMIGPALASLISILIMEIMQIAFSCRLLKCKWTEVVNHVHIFTLVIELCIVGFAVQYLMRFLSLDPILSLILGGGLIAATVGGINWKRIYGLIKEINSI